MKFIDDFLKKHSIEDIEREITNNTLDEYSTEDYTAFYGNGEVIIAPADETKEEIVYVIDTYGDRKYVVEY